MGKDFFINKVIKEIKKDEITYKLGYDLVDDKVYPYIEIYKNGELLSRGYWNDGQNEQSFCFYTELYSDFDYNSYASTIKELFTKLRENNDIPEEVENEYENIFLMYKLNDFNKL